MSQKFSPVSEKDISGAIVAEFAAQFQEYKDSDCIIIAQVIKKLEERGMIKTKGYGAILLSGERAAPAGGEWRDFLPGQNQEYENK